MQQRITVFDTTRRWLSVAALTSLAAFFGCATQPPTVPPGPTAEQQQLIADSQTTVSHFLRDPDMTWFQQHLGQARAVLVSPQVVKAGFIFGGSGGRAVGAALPSITSARRASASRRASPYPKRSSS